MPSIQETEGKKIRFLLASPGLDGHDIGPRLFARALMEAGMEVIFLGVKQPVPAIVNAAAQYE